jgi:hypothetical protein
MGLSTDRDMPSRFPEVVRANIPGATDQDIKSLQAMYPYPPDLPKKLAWDYTTDVDWSYNVANFASAYKNVARRQLFSVQPATHGLDIAYYFYDNRTVPMPSQADVDLAYATEAILLQFLFRQDFDLPVNASFAKKLSDWPVYGEGEVFANVTLSGFEIGAVPQDLRKKCDFIDALVRDPSKGV